MRGLVTTLLGLALALPGAALASATLQSVRGDVKAGTSAQALALARANQRLAAGATVVTGAGAEALLRFDDGQVVVLDQNSELRIIQYSFQGRPSEDRVVLDLLRGAARVTTGQVAASRAAWQLRTPQATLGVPESAEFIAVITNPLYLLVTQGSVVASNSAGAVTLGAGSISTVASAAALAAPISAVALPPAASGAFSNMMASLAEPSGGAAPGAPVATPAPAGGIGAGALGAAAAIAAGIAAASGSGGGGSGSSHQSAPSH